MNFMRWIFFLLLAAGPASWDFEKDEIDKPPGGFEFATTAKTPAGNWVVTKDGDGRVLSQLDADKTNGRFALALVKESSFKDLRLSVRARPVSGEVDQAAGLVWRYQDPENYYLVRSNVLESNVRLYRVVKGNRTKFAGKDEVKIKLGEWHLIRIEHRGTAIKVYLNGEMLFEAEDKTFPAGGKIGVWTKADSVTSFDDLTVEELK